MEHSKKTHPLYIKSREEWANFIHGKITARELGKRLGENTPERDLGVDNLAKLFEGKIIEDAS